MSGSGGYDGAGLVGGGGSGGGVDDSCDRLRLERYLQAPDPAVVPGLAVNDVLRVELRDDDPPTVVVLDGSGGEAGSVVPTTRLLACLRGGQEYVAVVLTLNGGAVQVTVQAPA